MNAPARSTDRLPFGPTFGSILIGFQILFLSCFVLVGLVGFYKLFVVRLFRNGWTSDAWVGLLPLVFVVFPGGVIVLLLRLHGRREEAPALPVLPPAGPIALLPLESRRSRLWSSVGMALFWNAIVAFFLAADVFVYASGEKLGLAIFLSLFLIPFALVGLFLVRSAWREFLGRSNPEPVVTLGMAAIPLGGSAQVDWRFTGRVERLTGLRITLEGIERATRRTASSGRGSSFTTRSSVFARREVFVTSEPAIAACGSASLAIPEGSVPTFKAKRNEICWRLELHAPTLRKPEVREEFEVEVVPREEEGGVS